MVGRVNAYLIEDSPLTLLDSGPNSAKALDELEQALAARGHAIEDIELLVDHPPAHRPLRARLDPRAPLGRGGGGARARSRRTSPATAARPTWTTRSPRTMMLRHGIPPEIVTALRAVSAGFRAWGSAVEVTRPLADGSELQLRDRTLRVLHRPGHSPSDTVFHDESRRMMLAADHLIAHISSNPLLARPLGTEPDYGGPAAAGADHLHGLAAKTREMDLDLVMPGHGRPITDHVSLIDERFRLHARRAEKIHRLIDEEPRTAHEIAQELWGNVAVTQAYLTLSEVLGHVDLLLRDGASWRKSRTAASSASAPSRRAARSPPGAPRWRGRRPRSSPRREPRIEDLLELRGGGGAQAEREHVRVVPAPRARRCRRVGAQRGAHARDLVRRDRCAGARPAAHDPLLGAPLRHIAGDRLARPRPVGALLRRRARRAAARCDRGAPPRRRGPARSP